MESRPGTDRSPSYDAPASAAQPVPEKTSVVEDFIDIFYMPSAVFARREKSGFWLHLLIVTALMAVFAFASRSVFSQIFDAEFARGTAKAMADNPRLTPDMVNSMRPVQEGIATFFLYLAAPITIFFIAFIGWLVAKVLSAKVTYGQAVMITTLAYIPRLVGSLIGVLQVVLMDTTNVTNAYSLSVSPARFMDPDVMNPKLFGLLGSFDVFAIWFVILIGIGIAVVGKVPRSKGYIAAAIIFVVSTIPLVMFR